MERIIISKSSRSKNGLDDDYTLFEDGEILHEYDANLYPSGLNRSRKLLPEDIKLDVKNRLFESASEEYKNLVKQILGLDEIG